MVSHAVFLQVQAMCRFQRSGGGFFFSLVCFGYINHCGQHCTAIIFLANLNTCAGIQLGTGIQSTLGSGFIWELVLAPYSSLL